VLPAGVVAALDGFPSLDFVELVTALRARFTVAFREAPPAAARVRDADDVALLEALTRP
jgi:2-C-methyl-D-erythritol 4-phosphate cytidylyltransferase